MSPRSKALGFVVELILPTAGATAEADLESIRPTGPSFAGNDLLCTCAKLSQSPWWEWPQVEYKKKKKK